MEIKFDRVNIIATVADAPWIVTSFIDELRRLIQLHDDESPIVGVDIKMDPSSTENLHYKAAATLQLCYRTHCIIIQLAHLVVIPSELNTFLADTKIQFVDYDIRDCLISKHEHHYGIFFNSHLHRLSSDSSDLAQRVHTDLGLNIDVPTSASSSYWGARTLTEEQIKYAAICAYAVTKLGVKIHKGSS